MNHFINVLKKYAQFTGRSSRAEYWFFVLGSTILSTLLSFFDSILYKYLGFAVLGSLYFLAIIVPSIAVGVRRLHDVGKSGKMVLVSLIPIVGPIWLLILMIQPSQSEQNEYGPVPSNDESQPDVDQTNVDKMINPQATDGVTVPPTPKQDYNFTPTPADVTTQPSVSPPMVPPAVQPTPVQSQDVSIQQTVDPVAIQPLQQQATSVPPIAQPATPVTPLEKQ